MSITVICALIVTASAACVVGFLSGLIVATIIISDPRGQ